MIWTNFKYFVKEGFFSFFRNWTMSLASVVIVTACLLTFGVYLAISTNLNNVMVTAKNELQIGFFINRETPDARVKEIGTQIEKTANVKSVQLVTGAEGLDKIPEQYRAGLTPSDLPNTYWVTFSDINQATQTTQQIMQISEIYKNTLSDATLNTIVSISHSINIFSAILMIIMIAISVFIIANTIRITVFARRNDINIMMYVGATRWFVRWPFIIEGMMIGFVGALISFGVMWYIYGLATSKVEGILNKFNDITAIITPITKFAATMGIWFVVIGVLIGGVGSLVSVRKHLSV